MAAKLPVKKVTAVVSALLLTGTAAMTAYAFLGSKPEEKVNTIKVGEQKETVQETFTSPDMQTQNDTVQKVVNVKNDGSVPCFVRVFLDLSDSRFSGGKVKLSANGTDYYSVTEFNSHLPEGWEYVSGQNNALDGYYYFTKALAPEEETPPLLSKVKTEFENVYDISDFDIIVYSESVQTVEINASGTQYSDYQKAWKSFLHISETP